MMVENCLPGEMLRQFARVNVRAAARCYLLKTVSGGARRPYYVAAGLGGFVAALSLLPLVMLLLTGRMRVVDQSG